MKEERLKGGIAGGRMMDVSSHCRGEETEGCRGKMSCAVRMKTPGDPGRKARKARKANSGVKRSRGRCGEEG